LKTKHRSFLHRHSVLYEQRELDFDREDTNRIAILAAAKQKASSVTVMREALIFEMHALLLYSDSLAGLGFVIDGTDRIGCVFNNCKDIPNSATEPKTIKS
jgi:hypothetical protein